MAPWNHETVHIAEFDRRCRPCKAHAHGYEKGILTDKDVSVVPSLWGGGRGRCRHTKSHDIDANAQTLVLTKGLVLAEK